MKFLILFFVIYNVCSQCICENSTESRLLSTSPSSAQFKDMSDLSEPSQLTTRSTRSSSDFIKSYFERKITSIPKHKGNKIIKPFSKVHFTKYNLIQKILKEKIHTQKKLPTKTVIDKDYLKLMVNSLRSGLYFM